MSVLIAHDSLTVRMELVRAFGALCGVGGSRDHAATDWSSACFPSSTPHRAPGRTARRRGEAGRRGRPVRARRGRARTCPAHAPSTAHSRVSPALPSERSVFVAASDARNSAASPASAFRSVSPRAIAHATSRSTVAA